jgi:hypothetical protein
MKPIFLGFIIICMVSSSCEKGETTGLDKKIEITIPSSFIIAPDTVPEQTDSILIKFNYIETNGCKRYKGVKIVAESQTVIDLQLIIEDESSPEVMCPTAIYEGVDKINVNMENKNELTINFLNENNETVFTREIVKNDNSSSEFTLKYKNTAVAYSEYFIDTMAIIFHNLESIEASEYVDTVFVNSTTGFVINKKNVPSEYSQLYYTLIRYFKNCNNGEFGCQQKMESLSGIFNIERNIPEVIKVHEDNL